MALSPYLAPYLTRPAPRALIAAGFLAVALVLGGGGSPSPAAEILVQLAFAAAVIAWVWWAERDRAVAGPPIPDGLWLIAALMLALPLLQLIPLPPAIWHSLPGRMLEVGSLALIGAEESWRPLSVAPQRTLAALLAIIPAVGLMLAVARLDLRERRLLLAVVALAALVGAVLGALQLAAGDQGAFQLYEKSHRGWLTGFFANRNAAVDALLIGSLALTAWLLPRADSRALSRSALAIFLMLQAALLIAAVLTGSRAGIALIPVALLVQFAMLGGSPLRRRLKPFALAAGAAALLLLLAPLVLGANARLGGVAQRFDATGDFRIEIWRDACAAMAAYWPFGSGIGTFSQAFQPFERLEVLDPFFPNRAHNDYLEFALEAGMFAPLLLIAVAVVLGRYAWRALAAGGEARSQALFALGTLAILGLHSFVDYPLRTMALAALAGVAAGLLAGPRNGNRAVEGTGTQE